MKDQSGPMLDAGLSGLLTDMDSRGLLDETLVVAVGEFGRSPEKGVSTSGNSNSADGRDHWPYNVGKRPTRGLAAQRFFFHI